MELQHIEEMFDLIKFYKDKAFEIRIPALMTDNQSQLALEYAREVCEFQKNTMFFELQNKILDIMNEV